MTDDKPVVNWMVNDKSRAHHGGGYRDEQEWRDEMFGRGLGDPDQFGYDWERDSVTIERRMTPVQSSTVAVELDLSECPF